MKHPYDELYLTLSWGARSGPPSGRRKALPGPGVSPGRLIRRVPLAIWIVINSDDAGDRYGIMAADSKRRTF